MNKLSETPGRLYFLPFGSELRRFRASLLGGNWPMVAANRGIDRTRFFSSFSGTIMPERFFCTEDAPFRRLSAVLLLCSGAALAQQAETPNDDDDARARLESVTVTAQKREQNLQEVPISVAVLTGEKLDVLTSGGLDVRLLS